MSLSIQNEVNLMRDAAQHNPQDISKAVSDSNFLEASQRKDEAAANSMQGVRKANGMMELSGKYQPDTLVDVGGGVMSRVDAAIAANLVPASTLGSPIGQILDQGSAPSDTESDAMSDTSPEFDIADLNASIPTEMQSQIQYVENVLGPQAMDELIGTALFDGMDDESPALAKLAHASGLSLEDAESSAKAAIEAKVLPLIKSFETLVGAKVNPQHTLEWLRSTSVTAKERNAMAIALKMGNGAGVSALAAKYKAEYSL